MAAATEAQFDANGIKFVDDSVDFAGPTRDADLLRVASSLCGWSSPDATIFQISGGITNLLFKLQPKDEHEAVLVRVFGAKTEMMINRERDNGESRKFLCTGRDVVSTDLCSCFSPTGRSEVWTQDVWLL